MSLAPQAVSPSSHAGIGAGIGAGITPGAAAEARMTSSAAAAAVGQRLLVVAALSLVAVVIAPVWVLLLSPLLLGLPHIAADLRWMIGRTPLGREGVRLAAVCGCLVAQVATGHLAFGLAAIPVAALASPSPNPDGNRLRVGLGVFGLFLVGVAVLQPTTTARVFAQAHNLVALLVLVVFTGRVRPLLVGLVVVAAASTALAAGLLDALVSSPIVRLPAPEGIDLPLLTRALGGTGVAGERYALLFAFGQLVHYGVWLWLLRSLEQARSDASTARDDLGVVWWWIVAVAAIGTLALLAWGAMDVLAARHGYFRFALFHGALELAALTILACEGGTGRQALPRSRPSSSSP